MEPQRLQKYLAHQGVASRRAIETMIEEGKITINGKHAKLGDKVTGKETITVNGKKFTSKNTTTKVIAFNKPRGVTSTTVGDQESGKTLAHFDFGPDRVYPVGRLDKESHGLLLMTNDGELANELTHPRYEHEKEYVVTVDRPLAGSMLEKLGNGSIKLGGRVVQEATVEQTDKMKFVITLKEGRTHQIRRMCDAVGLTVTDLERVRIASINLDGLLPGAMRDVSEIGKNLRTETKTSEATA